MLRVSPSCLRDRIPCPEANAYAENERMTGNKLNSVLFGQNKKPMSCSGQSSCLERRQQKEQKKLEPVNEPSSIRLTSLTTMAWRACFPKSMHLLQTKLAASLRICANSSLISKPNTQDFAPMKSPPFVFCISGGDPHLTASNGSLPMGPNPASQHGVIPPTHRSLMDTKGDGRLSICMLKAGQLPRLVLICRLLDIVSMKCSNAGQLRDMPGLRTNRVLRITLPVKSPCVISTRSKNWQATLIWEPTGYEQLLNRWGSSSHRPPVADSLLSIASSTG